MKIAVVASEAAPFVKTGGLGDVMQALPLALSKQKNTYVSLFIPYYSQIKYSGKWQTDSSSTVQSHSMTSLWRSVSS